MSNMCTKGKMVVALKKKGVRFGDKNGSTVKIEHLKTPQVVDLYYKHCEAN